MKVLPTVQDRMHAPGAVAPSTREAWINKTLDALPPSNRATCEAFLAEVAAQGAGLRTRANYITAIRTLEHMGRPYSKLTKQDVLKWVGWVDSTFSESTASLYKLVAKRFLKYVFNGELKGEYPKCVDFIKVRQPKTECGDKVLTKTEVKRLVQLAESDRDKAMLFVLYESGARVGEFVGIRLQDVEFAGNGSATIRVCGKTGERVIPIFDSIPALQHWIDQHPFKDHPDAAMWTGKCSGKRSIMVRQVEEIVRKYVKKAGIKKPITAHALRHSRATHLASVLKESELRQFFGWSRTSNMPSIYVHLTAKDVTESLRRHHGKLPKKKSKNPLEPQVCKWCEFENSAGARFCSRCARPLDETAAIQLELVRKEADDVTALVMQEFIKRGPQLLEEILKDNPKIVSKLKKYGG